MGARSKGCITCKSRKVRCSNEEPSCQRCQKAGLLCGGYKLIPRFVDENSRIERAEAKLRSQANDLNKNTHLHYHNSSLPTIAIGRNTGRLSKSLSLEGSRHDIIIRFLGMKLSEGVNHSHSTTKPLTWGFLEKGGESWVQNLPRESRKPLIALGSMFFGYAYKIPEMKQDALRWYGYALIDVRKNLACPNNALWYATMATITMLCMFELAANRSESGWIMHAQVLERLIMESGARKNSATSQKWLFREQRFLLAAKAIVTVTRTCFGEPEWKSKSWGDNLGEKPPFDLLIDILFDIANLRADFKTLSTAFTASAGEDLTLRALQILMSLNDWWRLWILKVPQPCHITTADDYNTLIKDDSGIILQTLLLYSDLGTAYTLCTYNAARILLLEVNTSIFGSLPTISTVALDEFNNTPLLGISSNTTELAREILRSIDYCNSQCNNFMGSFSVTLILDVACKALQTETREVRFLKMDDNNEGVSSLGSGGNKLALPMLSSCQINYKRTLLG